MPPENVSTKRPKGMEIATSSGLPLGARRQKTNHDATMPEMNPNQIAEAYRASVNEHRMTLFEAGRAYRKALFWSAVMGMVCQVLFLTQDYLGSSFIPRPSGYARKLTSRMKTIVMESYDQILIGSFYALPAFQKTFGFDTGNESYQVSAPWQSALSKERPELF